MTAQTGPAPPLQTGLDHGGCNCARSPIPREEGLGLCILEARKERLALHDLTVQATLNTSLKASNTYCQRAKAAKHSRLNPYRPGHSKIPCADGTKGASTPFQAGLDHSCILRVSQFIQDWVPLYNAKNHRKRS